MKKAFIFIVMVCLVPAMTVRATEPMMPGTFDVIIESCEGHEQLHFDLLVKPEDYSDDFVFDVDRIREDFQLDFPNYQDFDFLIQGEYISYSAYINPLYYYVPIPCTFHLETLIEDQADIYFLIFTDDGTVIYQEMFDMDELGYHDNYRKYTSIVYDVEHNLVKLDTRREMTIHETFLIIIFGIVMFLIIVISIPLVIILRRRNEYE